MTNRFTLAGATNLHLESEIVRAGGNYNQGTRYGDVLTAAGEAVASRVIEFDVPYQGLDAYIWRPADGSADITYQDEQAVSKSYTSVEEAGWFYTPDWDGLDAARMSAIWGDTAACTG